MKKQKESLVKKTDKDVIKELKKENSDLLDRLSESIKKQDELRGTSFQYNSEIIRKEGVIIQLQKEIEYLKQVNEADRYMLNFAKGQVDAYEKILGVDTSLDCNQDCCNG